MTQPQDKMRAEFEAWCAKDNPRYRHTDDGITSRRDWKVWQAACAQQSAQSQQDALDAARYRWLSNALADKVKGVSHHFCNVRSKIELDQSVDAAIATQGASNV